MKKNKSSFSKASTDDAEKRYSLSAGCLVLNPKNQILIIYQVENQYWEFPKGKVEPGEDTWSTAKRELAEETKITKFKRISGFKAKQKYQFQVNGEIIKRTAVYYLVRTDQEVKLSKEHSAYQWLSLDQAKKYLKYENQHLLIDKIKQYAI